MKRYKYKDWDFIFGDCGYFDPDQNIYLDTQGNPITGVLEGFYNFKGYKQGDSKNCQEVIEGKRVF